MVKRRIILFSESLRLGHTVPQAIEQYSADARAVAQLLKNNITALQQDEIEIEPRGFNGKKEFMAKLPIAVRDSFETFRHRSDEFEIFVVALSDSDTNDKSKITKIRRQLFRKIDHMLSERERARVHVMFAVQAIEAWVLADAQRLNEYLGVSNKAKHENEPEKIENPKQIVKNLFEQSRRKYTPLRLLELLPQLRISELQRCKHFNEFYNCITTIVNASGTRIS